MSLISSLFGRSPIRPMQQHMKAAVACAREVLPLVEAMAAGTPVVAANHGGVTEVVNHGETGLLVEPCDSAALAEALDQLLSDPEEACAMGAAGREARPCLED